MATASLEPLQDAERQSAETYFAAWDQYFTPVQRQQLIDEDLFAGRSVPLVLAAIVAAGLVLAIVSVCLTSF